MSAPRIAVAVAVASEDRAESLLRCLRAVVAGTLAPAELLVVDQSGTSTISAALAVTSLAMPIEHLPQDRLGLSASRNLALDRVRERFVAVTDDDCVPDPGWLAAIAAAFVADPGLAAITGPVQPLPPEGDRTQAVSSRSATVRRVYARRAAPWHVGTGGNMAFDRERLGRLRFDARLGTGAPGLAGEDLDLIDRLLGSGRRIQFEPAAIVRHERQTELRRVESRYGYGHGVGAMIGLALRRGDLAASVQLARWAMLRARLALGGRPLREELRVLRGTAAGLRYGLRAR